MTMERRQTAVVHQGASLLSTLVRVVMVKVQQMVKPLDTMDGLIDSHRAVNTGPVAELYQTW